MRLTTRRLAPAVGRRSPPASFNLPKSIDNVGYNYDANNNRVYKIYTGPPSNPVTSTTTSISGLYERRVSTSGVVSHVMYVHNGSRVVAQETWTESGTAVNAGPVQYLHDDVIGSASVTNTTNTTSGVTRLRYDPFGLRINPTNPTQAGPATPPTNRGFTEHEMDDEFGLINMKGRIFDPKIGRFLSADPIVSMPHRNNGYDRYGYALNNPLRYTDPSGFAIGTDPWLIAGYDGGGGFMDYLRATAKPECLYCTGGMTMKGNSDKLDIIAAEESDCLWQVGGLNREVGAGVNFDTFGPGLGNLGGGSPHREVGAGPSDPRTPWSPDRPPTGNDLSGDQRVRDILNNAWRDSFNKRPGEKYPHEEGGWIYGQPGSTSLKFNKGPRGDQMNPSSDRMGIDLRNPPVESGWYVIGDYHTHPGPTVDPRYPARPSEDDKSSNIGNGVPGLVRGINGGHPDIWVVGPERRRFGYTGPGGYPGFGP